MSLVQGSEEWARARLRGIGGSEASVLYGCNPWLNEYGLWALKTGRVEQPSATIHDTPAIYWGAALEGAVRRGYQDLTGRRVVEGHTLLEHPECHVLLANTDGTVVDVEGKPGPGVYEGKTASVFVRRDWYDGDGRPSIPLHYQVQVQHYLACTGFRWGSLAVYFGGDRNPLEWFDIERHDVLINDLVERASRWWHDHIILGRPPAVDGSAATEATLRKICPRDNGMMVRLPDEFAPVIDRLKAADEIIREAEAEKQRCRNLVISTLGEAAYGQTYDGRGFTFREERDGQRVLRLASPERMARARRETGSEYPPAAYVPPDVAMQVFGIASVAWGMNPPGNGQGFR